MTETTKLKLFLREVDCYDMQFFRENGGDNALAQLSALEADNAKLRERLNAACHVKAKDKVGFDFEVLDKLNDLDEAIRVIENLQKCADTNTSWAKRYVQDASAYLERVKKGA
jgi:hypothetical protein